MIDKPFPLRQKGIFQSWENGEKRFVNHIKGRTRFIFLSFLLFSFSLENKIVPVQGILLYPTFVKEKIQVRPAFQ